MSSAVSVESFVAKCEAEAELETKIIEFDAPDAGM
jgi:hypothetical protein